MSIWEIERELLNFFGTIIIGDLSIIIGLVNLASRRATYHLQYIKKLLIGPYSLVWRPLALSILRRVGNMEMDLTLFLMDHKILNFTGIPLFYQNFFKVWSLFKHQWMELAPSFYCLLEEPLVFRARFDVSGKDFPGLTDCYKSGYDSQKPEKVAALLEVQSIRFDKKFLDKLTMILTEDTFRRVW